MLVHAYRRVSAVTVNLFGVDIEFLAHTVSGNFVAEVTDERCIERLLDIPEAYRECKESHAAAPDEVKDHVAPPVNSNPLVLTNGPETLDLSDWSEKTVREFAQAHGVKLPGGKATKVSDLRLMLADGLRAQG